MGGLYTPPPNKKLSQLDFDEHVKSHAASALAFIKFKYPNLPHVHVDIVNNWELNAAASKYLERYFIGVTRGTYLLLFDIFNKIFATKSILPHLGDINLESEGKKTINVIQTGYGIELDPNPENIVMPNDKVRGFYAQAYISFALDFIIMHELGHILRGHNGFIYENIKGLIWKEIGNTQRKNKFITTLDSQTLEMDADSFATNWAFITAEVWHNRPLGDKNMALLFSDYSVFFGHWAFAIYTFFRLFGFYSLREKDINESSHPSPAIRASMVFRNIEPMLIARKMNIEEQEKIKEAIASAIEAADIAFTEVTYHERSINTFFEVHKNADSYVTKLLYNWNLVRPKLEPFAFTVLPVLNKLAQSKTKIE